MRLLRRSVLVGLLLLVSASTASSTGASYTIVPPSRQAMEALRDACHLWVMTTGAALGPAHPLTIFMTTLRDDLTHQYVDAHP